MKMKKSLITLLFCLAFAKGHAQINPQTQINWANSTGCSTVGQPYIPASNTCVALGDVLFAPTGAQTIVQPSLSQPLNVNYLAPMFVNGAVQAAAFCGSGTVGGIALPSCSADACVKLYAANRYAVANNFPLVDASGLVGTQLCSVNPFNSLNATIGNSVNLTDKFGSTHFQSSVVWQITNSGISLLGAGPFSTMVEYTGSSCTASPGSCAVLWANTDGGSGTPASNGGPNGIVIRDMSFFGDTANVFDDVILEVSRSRIDNLYAWGATTCGIRLHGAEENTVTHPVVSATAAFFMGIQSHTTPANGICFDEDTVNGTNSVTSTTISDPVMEFVSGIGIDVIGGNNIVITGGTSEGNGTGSSAGAGMTVGVHAGVVNQQITVIGTDFEGNGSATGADVSDNGASDVYINILATSNNNSVNVNGNGTSATGLIFGGLFGPSGTGIPQGVASNGIPNPGAVFTGTCTQSGTMTEMFRGVLVYVPYCAVHP